MTLYCFVVTARSRGNGQANSVAGCGAALYWDGGLFWQGREFIGLGKTNNEAEYGGLLHGLRHCGPNIASHITVFGDSKLVVKQVLGEWRVEKPHLKPLAEEAKAALEEFGSFQLLHVLRDGNKEADRLANEAMDERRSWNTVIEANCPPGVRSPVAAKQVSAAAARHQSGDAPRCRATTANDGTSQEQCVVVSMGHADVQPSPWACQSCTFINAAQASDCEVCGTEQQQMHQTAEWNCTACTFANTNHGVGDRVVRCEVCGVGR